MSFIWGGQIFERNSSLREKAMNGKKKLARWLLVPNTQKLKQVISSHIGGISLIAHLSKDTTGQK